MANIKTRCFPVYLYRCPFGTFKGASGVDGTLNTTNRKLKNSVTQEDTITNTEQEERPRWDKLKKLITDK
jgi:hypothetical protein